MRWRPGDITSLPKGHDAWVVGDEPVVVVDGFGASGYAKRTSILSKQKELVMGRKYVDCREMPSDSQCTVAISADSEKELMDVAVQHAVKTHGHHDTPEFREMLRKVIKDGSPPP